MRHTRLCVGTTSPVVQRHQNQRVVLRSESTRRVLNVSRHGLIDWRIYSSDLDEVDPITGEIIQGTSKAKVASERAQVGKFTWAYRHGEIPEGVGRVSCGPVVCLHGIGSSSYAYRKTINLLAADGFDAYAVDWIGHGQSSMPAIGDFSYSQEEYIKELGACLQALDIGSDATLVVHGYILGQFALLFAARHPERISKVVCLNVPLGLNVKLRPELAQYKSPIPFLKPKEDAIFDGAMFAANGGPYALDGNDAEAYAEPYKANRNASKAIWHTMENVNWENLKKDVNEAMMSFKIRTLLIHGNADTFCDLSTTLDWLEDKRTSMQMAYGIEAKLGHCPQEDYPEAIHPTIVRFLTSEA